MVFKSEIGMPGEWLADVRYFTSNPDKAELAVKQMTNFGVYL
jgi:hypothetical protein